MTNNKQKKSFNRTMGTLSVLMLLVLFVFDITYVRADITVQVLIYWIFCGLALLTLFVKPGIKVRSLYLLFFSVYIVTITIISQTMNISSFLINFGYMTLWIWIIILFTYVNEKNDFDERLFKLIAIFTIFIGIYITINYNVKKLEGDWGFVNKNYYLLCVMPILLLIKKSAIKRIAIIVACVTIFLSLKRTGITALFSMAFILIIYYFRRNSRFKIKAIIAALLILIVGLNYQKITEYFGVDVLNRFDTMSEDGGSGRIEIYKQCLTTIVNSSPFRLFFGCGYNGFINFYGSELSSHNDILEILIDYGVFGLSFYLWIILHYIKICLYNIKHRTTYAEACIASLCAFTTITLFGHCVIYPSYFMFILIFWIYVERKTIYMKKKSLKEQC